MRHTCLDSVNHRHTEMLFYLLTFLGYLMLSRVLRVQLVREVSTIFRDGRTALGFSRVVGFPHECPVVSAADQGYRPNR